jgi:RNA polymerase sigma-70 factor (sigma-E family)
VSFGGDHFVAEACADAGQAGGAEPGRPRDAVTERAAQVGGQVPRARDSQQDTRRGQPAGLASPAALAGPAGPARSAGPPGSPALDDPCFREYVAARSRSLLRAAYLLTGNIADAEDLVQSALAKTYQAWDRIEDRAALDGYVRRAMVNTHISWWRRRRVEEFPTDEVPDQVVADPSGDSDLADTLRRAIDRLPQRMRAAVVLRYYQDMTEAEVADALGVSLGTVKSTVSRAVAKLRIDAELLAD